MSVTFHCMIAIDRALVASSLIQQNRLFHLIYKRDVDDCMSLIKSRDSRQPIWSTTARTVESKINCRIFKKLYRHIWTMKFSEGEQCQGKTTCRYDRTMSMIKDAVMRWCIILSGLWLFKPRATFLSAWGDSDSLAELKDLVQSGRS